MIGLLVAFGIVNISVQPPEYLVQLNYNNQFVQKKRDQMDLLIDEWRELTIDQKDIKNRILEESISVAEDLSNVKEKSLNPISKLRKYYYTSYGYFLASDLECDLDQALIYNKKALENGEKTLTFINEIKKNPTDPKFSEIEDDFKKLFSNSIHHLLALIYIVKIKLRPDDNKTEAIKETEVHLNSISSSYKKNNFYKEKKNRYICPFLCIYNPNKANQDNINCSEFSSFEQINFCGNVINKYYINNLKKSGNSRQLAAN